VEIIEILETTMTVRTTVHAYPWDLARLGVERSMGEIAGHGIGGVNLASTYHPIDSLSPRGGVRLYTSARGAVHFPARPERYGRIVPRLSAPEVVGAWPSAEREAAAVGIDLNAWTVTLFQPWIVDAHPDTARCLPSGDANGSGMCPAHPDVQAFVAALCEDLVDQFGPRTIHLEGISPLWFGTDWLRSRILVELSDLARELLSLCFCANCESSARAAGLDVERIRRLVEDGVAGELAGAGGLGPEEVAAEAEVHAFAVQHERASIDLARAARSGAGDQRGTRISSTIWTPFPSLVAPSDEQLMAELSGVVDQVTVGTSGPYLARGRHLVDIASRPDASLELAVMATRMPAAPGSPGGRNGASPESEDPAIEVLRAASELPVAEVSLYNYGLLRADDLARGAAAVREIFA
jgi:hypothetical protein